MCRREKEDEGKNDGRFVCVCVCLCVCVCEGVSV